ncbi:hypothetical protein ABZZ74_54335 [Streptomyces sp. NPDC006476]|uniref:hypothetical protein n=1 Tax=Streptomyces sp. NPDC006476 TaxID=3157175 RepID=UPI0033BA6BC9
MTSRTHKRTRKVTWTVAAAAAAASAFAGIGWVHAYADEPGNAPVEICVLAAITKGIEVTGTNPEGRTVTSPAVDLDGTKQESCHFSGNWRIGSSISVKYASSTPPISDPAPGVPLQVLLDPAFVKDGKTFQVFLHDGIG